MEHSASPWWYRTASIFSILVVVICCLKLLYIERWLVDNDNYATLGTFFLKTKDPRYLESARAFHAAAVASCSAQDKRCVAYSQAIHGEQTYARPIVAYFGSFLAQPTWLESEARFLEGIAKATVLQVVVSTLVLFLLLLCFLRPLPRPVAAIIAGMSALLGVAMYWLPEYAPYWYFQPLLGVSFGGVIALLVLLLGIWLYARSAPHRFRSAWESISASDRPIRILWILALGVFAVRVVSGIFPALNPPDRIFGSGVGLLSLVLLFFGLAVFIAAISAAAVREKAEFDVIWVSIFLLLGFLADTYFFTVMFSIGAKAYIFLLAGPILVYIAFYPNGRALWLLPALLLFHVSIAGLLYGCIIATETIMAIRRRSVSRALVLSTLLLVAALVHTAMTSGNAVSVSDSTIAAFAPMRTSLLPWIPGVIVMLILAYAGYVAWRLSHEAGDLLLRAIVLAALLAGAGQLRHALQSAGYDMVDPNAFMFILLSRYLAPIVCSAGTFLVVFALVMSGRNFAVRRFDLDMRTVALVAAGVFALAMVRTGNSIGRPFNVLPAIASAVQLVATQKSSARIDPLVMQAAAPNDRYVVGYFPADATTMMSLLKLKARWTAGLFDPKQMQVVVAKRAR